jgi:polyphenol oxidase
MSLARRVEDMTPLDGFAWIARSWGAALQSAPLAEGADHFFTTRQLRLRGESERADWASVAAAIGVPAHRLLRLNQVHGREAIVRRADSRDPDAAGGGGLAPPPGDDEASWPKADILATDDPAVALVVQVADCVPLLMADPRSGAVAAVHAGWRGTAAGAAPAAVHALGREFGADPTDLVVAQGPSIGPCCYVVGEEVADRFAADGWGREAGGWFERDEAGALRLDLWKANRDQLVACGVPPDRIHQSGLCTASHPEWFASYRRDGPGTGRIAAVIRSRRVA